MQKVSKTDGFFDGFFDWFFSGFLIGFWIVLIDFFSILLIEFLIEF